MKSFIGKILESEDCEQRTDGTLATIVISAANGADIVRVHDVKRAKSAIKIIDAMNSVN